MHDAAQTIVAGNPGLSLLKIASIVLSLSLLLGGLCWGVLARGHQELPVTTHPVSATRTANRLSAEKSPYLLQHANNPVDWYPWGPEAFEKARKEDKPVFLSIGYSTCHWCHVMEHESFEDPQVARLLNDAFVCIKVDREERPDVDGIYMTVCQAMTGGGGWPLTIIMTPDKKPFFAGTYIPKEDRFGRMGLVDLIPRVKGLWASRRQDVVASADQIIDAVRRAASQTAGGDLDRGVIDTAFQQVGMRFDPVHGGFGEAPKFPTPHTLSFLLRYRHRTGDERALTMLSRTLDAMRCGGIYDHVGFGFHRYSTDAAWLVPHYEKMLYDQALLTIAYTEAFQAMETPLYRDTAREILTYVLRDMTDTGGGFYSAEDADSEGQEGKFYLWTESEIRKVLPPHEAEQVITAFNVHPEGNFVDPVAGHSDGENILHLVGPLDQVAGDAKTTPQELRRCWEAARPKLFACREQRIRPHKDDKILTDWNGLMIAALARAAQAFDEPRYAQAARRAADFILTRMRTPDGRLLHRYRDGQAAVNAHLDDYAFLVWGLIDLYEATFEIGYLRAAIDLNAQMIAHFWDAKHGGFYFTADDGEELIVRQKEIHDGAIPSGNAVAMLNLLRLGRMTSAPDMEAMAASLGRAFSESIRRTPAAHTEMMVAADLALGPAHEVVVVGNPHAGDTQAMLKAIRSRFLPNTVVLLRPGGDRDGELASLVPFTAEFRPLDGRATAYVCRNGTCNLPTTDLAKMLKELENPSGPDLAAQ
jgi:uncharacterized protein